ncbi:MAG: TadE/TadG family type IV pilus assembly protein [Planctomycetota bacterium]
MRKVTRLQHERRGATVIEFAIVAPVLFITILACMELTRFYMMGAMAEDAAYFAARHVMVPGATLNEGVLMANESLNTVGATGTLVSVQAFNGTTEQTEIDADTTDITVTISVPVADNAMFVPLFLTTGTIVKTVTLETERFTGYFDGNTP